MADNRSLHVLRDLSLDLFNSLLFQTFSRYLSFFICPRLHRRLCLSQLRLFPPFLYAVLLALFAFFALFIIFDIFAIFAISAIFLRLSPRLAVANTLKFDLSPCHPVVFSKPAFRFRYPSHIHTLALATRRLRHFRATLFFIESTS